VQDRPSAEVYEKLGLFYLGRSYDTATKALGDDLILYDSRDLVTHAVCVGMTGSGKTGLCLSLLEEAAIDHVPAIAVDPKGDIANLLLTFPELRGEDFAPWVEEGEAKKSGVSVEEFAAKQAETWKKGLAEWGQDGARIQRLRESADFRIYTPGSSAGLPISILQSFSAPPAALREDLEALNERVASTVDSLLGLLKIDADPVQSREHILISNILAAEWKAERSLDIAGMIPAIQNPPFSRVGVMELESFFPSKERFALAMRLNNLLAAPGFESWLQGEPLVVDTLFHAPDGKPRISIISIAHLGDSERMFFVSLLLNQLLAWARSQAGTSSLRAIFYMDEIFGYFPPIAAPPSKRPLLTLLKQARAYGLGVVLATQNPADLDYKGLSNAGTWFLGRLQAERDKMRVLEGLEGAAAAQSAKFERQEMDSMLSGLGKRTFLLHNVHNNHPEVFQVRWALSYLRGPLTRQQIKQLMDPLKAAAAPPASVAASQGIPQPAPEPASPPAQPASQAAGVASGPLGGERRPMLDPDVPQFFVPLRRKPSAGQTILYRPAIFGFGQIYFSDTKSGASTTETVGRLALLTAETPPFEWTLAARVDFGPNDLDAEPAEAARYDSLPASAAKTKSYTAWTKAFVDALYRGETLELMKSPTLNTWSNPSETERAFRVRLQQAAKEERDLQLDKLRARYAPKLAALAEKIRRAEAALSREEAQARTSGLNSLVKFGTTVLGAVVGRRMISQTTINKAGTALRNATQTAKESSDVGRARKALADLNQQAVDLDAEFRSESRALAQKIDPLQEELTSVVLKPKKTNITPQLVALAWTPFHVASDGTTTSAWD
jgi:hypothetical protein